MKRSNNRPYTKLRMILQFMEGSKRWFLLSMLLTVCVSLFELINPKIISFTVDTVIGSEPNPYTAGPIASLIAAFGGVETLKEKMWILAISILVVSVFALIFKYFFKLTNSVGAESLVYNMRERLFAHIGRLPFSWHGENSTGDIIQRCTSDVDMVKRFISDQLTSVFRIVVLLAMSLVFMFGINTSLALVSLATIPVIVAYSAVFHKKIGSRFKDCDEAEGKLSAIAQENLTGVRVVRAFGREKYERERFAAQSGLYADLWIRLNKLFSLFWGTGDLVSGLQVMLIIVLGASICVKGNMTAGDFIAFVSYNSMLIWPVRALGRMISQMSQANIALDRIFYIMNSREETDKAETLSPDLDGDIRFENVSCEFVKGVPVLKDVSFEIKGGSTFGILGGTGSGKSVLMYLLERLYPLAPENGRITISGVDVADMPAHHLRRGIGMVMQEPFLFSRTIAENISITRRESDPEGIEADIKRSSDVACLTETVDSFASGYDTFVGERGVTLSGGQKQRVAIARMLTSRTPIMIFDDALSAVDAETDAKIRNALRRSTGKATVILISHRISTLMHADNIIVLEKGRIAESGTHESLLAGNGIYKKIYDIQTMHGEEAEEVDDAGN